VPPLVGVAVKVTEVPVQIEVALALTLTLGATDEFTVIVTAFDVALDVPFVKVMFGRMDAVAVPVV